MGQPWNPGRDSGITNPAYLSRPNCLGISEHQATTSDDAVQNDTITLVFLKKIITLILLTITTQGGTSHGVLPSSPSNIFHQYAIILSHIASALHRKAPFAAQPTTTATIRESSHHTEPHSRNSTAQAHCYYISCFWSLSITSKFDCRFAFPQPSPFLLQA